MMQPLRDDLMVQEQIDNDPWKMFVGCIMLNQTGRKQVKIILPEFLARWTDADSLLGADPGEISEVVKPLGMYNRRSHTLIRMSQDWKYWNGIDATKLYGIGRYGSDSYEIFFNGRRDITPTDHELCRYLGLPDPRKNRKKHNDKDR